MKLSIVARVTGQEVIFLEKELNPYYDKPNFDNVRTDLNHALDLVAQNLKVSVRRLPPDVQNAIGKSDRELEYEMAIGRAVPFKAEIGELEDTPSKVATQYYRVHILLPKLEEETPKQ